MVVASSRPADSIDRAEEANFSPVFYGQNIHHLPLVVRNTYFYYSK